jgi:hypothetical protein
MNIARTRLILNTLILLFSLNSQAVANNNCISLFSNHTNQPLFQNEKKQSEQTQALELQKTQGLLERNSFTTARDLNEYASHLKIDLLLPELNSSKRWLDAGAGRARAQLQFLEMKKKSSESPPEMVALSYKKPWFVTAKKESFKYLEGRFIEDYHPSELGSFDLITDLFGPYSYSKNPITVLNQYLELLNVHGNLRIYSTSVTSDIWANGQLISINTWISQTLNTPQAKAIFETEVKHGLISVRRINKGSFQLPSINLILFSSDTPPHRKYQIDSTPED